MRPGSLAPLGLAALAALAPADRAAAQAAGAVTRSAFIGATGVLSNDVAGEVALFAEGVAGIAGASLHLRGSYATSVVFGGDDRHAALLRDPAVHGRSVEVGAGYGLRLPGGLLVTPGVRGGVNFADWAAAPPDTRREAGAVLFAAASVGGSSRDLDPAAEREVRAVAEVAVLGRWIRSAVGKDPDLRLLLLGSDRRDYAGLELSLSVQTALVKPRLRVTWFPAHQDAGVSGLTETRLSADLEVRAPLF